MPSSSYSPRDTSVSRHDLSSLTQHFGQQSLRHDARNVGTAYHTPASSGRYHNHSSVSQSHASSSSTHNTTASSHQSLSTSQRQPGSIAQCQAGHMQENMAAPEQCQICNATILPQTEHPDTWIEEAIGQEDDFEDEGFEEPPSMARLTYRRSTDLTAGGQGYVAKAIRVRKKHRSDPSRLR